MEWAEGILLVLVFAEKIFLFEHWYLIIGLFWPKVPTSFCSVKKTKTANFDSFGLVTNLTHQAIIPAGIIVQLQWHNLRKNSLFMNSMKIRACQFWQSICKFQRNHKFHSLVYTSEQENTPKCCLTQIWDEKMSCNIHFLSKQHNKKNSNFP